MSTKLNPVRGTHDLLPELCAQFDYIISTAKKTAELFNFDGFDTPIFEATDVFKRTLGDASDIVNKEMYTFQDRGGDSLTLRPEGTAGIARAFISNGMTQNLPLKLFYNGPMFRYERPQKGRQRQFHQLGVEYLGIAEPYADTEVLSLAYLILKKLNLLENSTLEINSIGDTESRTKYKSELVKYLSQFKSNLSPDSQKRLEANPLRILDSKDENDAKIIKNAPLLTEYLNSESKDFFNTVTNQLKSLNIPFNTNPLLVRGLDYYNHTVFEFKTSALGAQDAILSGGRYDNLIEQMGGPATPGVGWAAGIERLALLLKTQPSKMRPIAILSVGDEATKESLPLAFLLKENGIKSEIIFGNNFGKLMKKANKINAIKAIIIGENEMKSGQYAVKDLDSGQQVAFTKDALIKELVR